MNEQIKSRMSAQNVRSGDVFNGKVISFVETLGHERERGGYINSVEFIPVVCRFHLADRSVFSCGVNDIVAVELGSER